MKYAMNKDGMETSKSENGTRDGTVQGLLFLMSSEHLKQIVFTAMIKILTLGFIFLQSPTTNHEQCRPQSPDQQ